MSRRSSPPADAAEITAVIPSLLSSNRPSFETVIVSAMLTGTNASAQATYAQNERVVRSFSSSARIRSFIGLLLPGGELEEHLLEVEVLRRHLVDDRADAGGGQADRLGGGLKGDERIGGDELGGDALSGERGAQRLGLRRSHSHTGSATGWPARRARTG